MMLTPAELKKYKQSIQTPELDDRDTLLESLDKMLKESATMETRYRWSPRRVQRLCAMKTGLAKYQEALMAQQVTLKQMRDALDKELRVVGSG